MYPLAHLNTTPPSGKASHSMHQLGLLECSHARGVEEGTCVITAQIIDYWRAGLQKSEHEPC